MPPPVRAGGVHAAHVHSFASQGSVALMLPDLTADANGDISVTDTGT